MAYTGSSCAPCLQECIHMGSRTGPCSFHHVRKLFNCLQGNSILCTHSVK